MQPSDPSDRKETANNKESYSSAYTFPQKELVLEWCAQNPDHKWDMIVIGGGIVGAGVLLEASKQGLSALLIEQKDFAWGTSSRSSKMVHGGLRYIAKGDVKLTKHSLIEREWLLKEYPGLITRMGYYFLLRKGQFPGRFLMTTLLKIYDCLAGIKDHRFYNNKHVAATFPDVDVSKLNGACYYTDTVVDDARLVLRVISDAITHGGKALNYLKAVDLVYSDDAQKVNGVLVQQCDNSPQSNCFKEPMKLHAKVVINATGAWADKLRVKVINEKRVRPLRGSHILFPLDKIVVKTALTLSHPTDKRGVFIFPWQGATIVGTTDIDHPHDLDIEAKITHEEISYLLEVIHFNFPDKRLTSKDILSSYAGVRPIIGSDKSKDPSKERRDHAIWADKGLITVSGGKLTTFRLIAMDVLSKAKPWLNNLVKAHTPVNENILTNTDEETLRLNSVDSPISQHFRQKYGVKHNAKIAGFLLNTPAKELCFIENTPFCLADCRWALKFEAVSHLDDLLLRRTRLGLLLPFGAKSLFGDVKELCQQELHWSDEKWQSELDRYQAIWINNYSVPA